VIRSVENRGQVVEKPRLTLPRYHGAACSPLLALPSLLAGGSLFLLQPLVARALVPLYGGTSWVLDRGIGLLPVVADPGLCGRDEARSSGRPGDLHARVAALALLFAFGGILGAAPANEPSIDYPSNSPFSCICS
jgi:hypothetical protein